MRRLGLALVVGAMFLNAEKNGAFVGGGFEYSYFNSTYKQNVTGFLIQDLRYHISFSMPGRSYPTQIYKGNLYGGNLQAGYKQFFGYKKRFGLRYYGFFSAQGGDYAYRAQIGFNARTQKPIYAPATQPSINFFYGAGVDFLYNFYEKGHWGYGLFLGVMIGGSSWLMDKSYAKNKCQYLALNADFMPIECISMEDFYQNAYKKSKNPKEGYSAHFNPTYVQVIVNVGFRFHFKHQGFELGVRIPTINDPYFQATNTKVNGYLKIAGPGSQESYTLRRVVSVYINYVYGF
ncbi:outer membrane protein [Helicobacter bizzozeronii]|uniref:OMP1551 n=1 Tax=Helicobacter bizzozeronii TaxID=56877 RepID=A0A1M4NHU8_HELBI|nr:outer membrane protein [Helicobacter bizzozeronii]SFZ71621.1 OMP1551 [Helicobacter bizzozeronii]